MKKINLQITKYEAIKKNLFSFGKTAVHVKEKKMAAKTRQRYRLRQNKAAIQVMTEA